MNSRDKRNKANYLKKKKTKQNKINCNLTMKKLRQH